MPEITVAIEIDTEAKKEKLSFDCLVAAYLPRDPGLSHIPTDKDRLEVGGPRGHSLMSIHHVCDVSIV